MTGETYIHANVSGLLAVDLPSGINTDTGEVAEGAAHADLTVTFDSYKPLHIAEASAPLCGKIVCADIGIRDEWHPEFYRGLASAEKHPRTKEPGSFQGTPGFFLSFCCKTSALSWQNAENAKTA